MKYVERKTHRTSAGKSIKNIVVTVLSLLVFLLFGSMSRFSTS